MLMFASFGWKFEYCTFPGTSQKLRKIHDLGDLADNLSRTFFCNLQWKQVFFENIKAYEHYSVIGLFQHVPKQPIFPEKGL